MGGDYHDLSISADYSLSSGGHDSSPKVFLNATRHNGSGTVTSFQTSIQAVSVSNTAGDGYLGLGASATPDDLAIRPSGNIGIGENNPQNSLHISGSSAIRFADTGANGSAFSIIEDNNGLLKSRNDASNVGTGSGIVFEVDASEKLRIKSGGEITSGNISINAFAHQNTPSGYAQFSI